MFGNVHPLGQKRSQRMVPIVGTLPSWGQRRGVGTWLCMPGIFECKCCNTQTGALFFSTETCRNKAGKMLVLQAGKLRHGASDLGRSTHPSAKIIEHRTWSLEIHPAWSRVSLWVSDYAWHHPIKHGGTLCWANRAVGERCDRISDGVTEHRTLFWPWMEDELEGGEQGKGACSLTPGHGAGSVTRCRRDQ